MFCPNLPGVESPSPPSLHPTKPLNGHKHAARNYLPTYLLLSSPSSPLLLSSPSSPLLHLLSFLSSPSSPLLIQSLHPLQDCGKGAWSLVTRSFASLSVSRLWDVFGFDPNQEPTQSIVPPSSICSHVSINQTFKTKGQQFYIKSFTKLAPQNHFLGLEKGSPHEWPQPLTRDRGAATVPQKMTTLVLC